MSLQISNGLQLTFLCNLFFRAFVLSSLVFRILTLSTDIVEFDLIKLVDEIHLFLNELLDMLHRSTRHVPAAVCSVSADSPVCCVSSSSRDWVSQVSSMKTNTCKNKN
jgi:hypothetical protein